MTQLTIHDAAQGLALKEAGLASMEETDREFVTYMRQVAKDISDKSGFCTSDNLRVYASKLGIEPKHPNSWGGCIRGKGWRIIGYQKSALPSNHGRPIAIWKWESLMKGETCGD